MTSRLQPGYTWSPYPAHLTAGAADSLVSESSRDSYQINQILKNPHKVKCTAQRYQSQAVNVSLSIMLEVSIIVLYMVYYEQVGYYWTSVVFQV